jgi:signal transduction histidine kinase
VTALSIAALCVYIFGAYAYGAVVVLALRYRSPVWSAPAPELPKRLRAAWVGLAMFVLCTVWFVVHSIIEFRYLMGDARQDDLFDLSTLILVFAFPGLILHTVLVETSHAAPSQPPGRWWWVIVAGLYLVGAVMASYVPLAIFRLLPGDHSIGASIGITIGSLFLITSVCSLILTSTRRRSAATRDQRRLRLSLTGLYIVMIAVFLPLAFMRERQTFIEVLDALVRMTPLAFLLVSIYFESRFEFYDLVIKRAVLLAVTLLITGATLAATLSVADGLPDTMARPWLFAVLLLPVAMLMPWVHGHTARLLDRWWFGRAFTPVEAVKHVLGAMQQATDEASLIRAAESTLSEMFQRRLSIAIDRAPLATDATLAAEMTTAVTGSPIRAGVIQEPGARPLLSEDLTLLRSLLGVFGFMLENVRLQHKRKEQEQIAQALRLQSSRSELKALRAQINPHFLFNALNAIASLIHTDPGRADTAVEQLAEVFRYTLRRSEQEWAPLDQELAFARAYLDVEQARFGSRLAFSIDADPSLAGLQVPSMLLQTLVENAVKHGISRVRGAGRIEVRATGHDGRLRLEVRDTGPGPELPMTGDSPRDNGRQGLSPLQPQTGTVPQAPLHPAEGEGFGLRSVRERLAGYFGTDASLDLAREDGWTVARLDLPIVHHTSPMLGAARG